MRSALVFLAILPACLTPETADDTGDTFPSGVTIKQIQMGDVAEDETVTLKNVVVTSAITTKGDGFFIQDAGGGEYSGLYVYLQAGIDTLYIEPGFTVTLTGSVTEFYDWTEFSVTSETAIEVNGSGSVTVDAVDPAAVESWEAWESCLISVGAAEVSEGLNNYNEAVLDNGLKIDDLLWVFDVEAGSSFTNVTGPLGYSYEEWKLFPRFEADLEGYTPPVIEATTIQDIQQGNSTGTVILEEVVVTSPMTKKDGVNNGFFVQAQGGGEWSGLFVYRKDGFGSYLAEIGDVLTLQGEITEFYDATQIVVKDVEDLTDTETTASLVKGFLDPANVSDWEGWESCYVSLGTVSAVSDVDQYGEVETTAGINIDNLFYQFPATNGQTWSDVSGVLGYSYGAFKIWPRSEADMVD
jgi:predicted extracellular nuclease